MRSATWSLLHQQAGNFAAGVAPELNAIHSSLLDVLPALKDGDSFFQRRTSATENV